MQYRPVYFIQRQPLQYTVTSSTYLYQISEWLERNGVAVTLNDDTLTEDTGGMYTHRYRRIIIAPGPAKEALGCRRW